MQGLEGEPETLHEKHLHLLERSYQVYMWLWQDVVQ